MPEYINPHKHAVHLLNKDGNVVKIMPKQRKTLPVGDYDKYVARGLIKPIQIPVQRIQRPIAKPNIAIPGKQIKSQPINKQQNQIKAQKIIRNKAKKIVGSRIKEDASKLLHKNIDKNCYPISNNIGIGILSYNRPHSLKRLINSIYKYTNLCKTTVFISDDGSTEPELLQFLNNLPNIVVLKNDTRVGIAANTNRLLKCLSRFRYGLLLNDDIEILSNGWEHFYFNAMAKTNMHHFIYRQSGVYGSKDGNQTQINGAQLTVVDSKPQGAVLAFDNTMFKKCGYFDEKYGIYGMEHVDWSMKAWEFGLQRPGFYDVVGSDKFFKLHSDKSVILDRSKHLQESRKLFADRVGGVCCGDSDIKVPEISYVIPFRDVNRCKSILTVVNNIRAQKFPVINILLVEQDSKSRISMGDFEPVEYYLASEERNFEPYNLFNKSKAFNLGVSKVKTDNVVLHDADILVQNIYTDYIYNILQKYDSCHVGKTVVYTTKKNTDIINSSGAVGGDCDRIVGYFEGGSLACSVKTYWKVGGFNEDFWGYGVEDCEFYHRLSHASNWHEQRIFDFCHLWHNRVSNWNNHHNKNKELGKKLSQIPLTQRIAMQHQQLKDNGYEY